MWRTLSSKQLFEHPRLVLIEDEVLLPNGVKTKYLRFKDAGNAVTIICKREDGYILLQKEYSYPTSQLLYQFPGGFVPFSEDVATGANRELMEESKYQAKKLTPLGSYFIDNRRSNSKMYVFLGTDLEKKSLRADALEFIESYWFSEEEIESMIRNGEIVNFSVLAAWSLYLLKKH